MSRANYEEKDIRNAAILYIRKYVLVYVYVPCAVFDRQVSTMFSYISSKLNYEPLHIRLLNILNIHWSVVECFNETKKYKLTYIQYNYITDS